MLSLIQKVSSGNALRVLLMPPAQATRIRLLRKDEDTFSGPDDPAALVVSDGMDKFITDFAGLVNGERVFYRAYYLIYGVWTPTATVSAVPSATFVDVSVDPMALVRERVELGLKVYLDRGVLTHERGFIPVLTASPMIEDVPLPLVTVHLAADAPDMRSVGEVIRDDVYTDSNGLWHSFEGGYSRTDLTVVVWALNADERIAMRNALKAVLMANLPVFDAAGLMLVSWNFTDQEDFQTYAAPVYQAICNFTCYAPSAVESVDSAIRDVVSNFVYEVPNG